MENLTECVFCHGWYELLRTIGKHEPLPEPEPLDLPEDLQLDDDDEKKEGGNEDGEEENPFDIDKMKGECHLRQ